jgi:hypothetical protein
VAKRCASRARLHTSSGVALVRVRHGTHPPALRIRGRWSRRSCVTHSLIPHARRRVDEDASAYLGDLLAAVDAENGGEGQGVAPIRVEGDGYCMMHAVSRAIFGAEVRTRALTR